MKLVNTRNKSEIEKFNAKFPRSKLHKNKIRVGVTTTPDGKIISIDSDDKDIIAYAKKLGLVTDG